MTPMDIDIEYILNQYAEMAKQNLIANAHIAYLQKQAAAPKPPVEPTK
jgi:hypothetical protein